MTGKLAVICEAAFAVSILAITFWLATGIGAGHRQPGDIVVVLALAYLSGFSVIRAIIVASRNL